MKIISIVFCFVLLCGFLHCEEGTEFSITDIKKAYEEDRGQFSEKMKSSVLKKLEKIEKLDINIEFQEMLPTLTGRFASIRLDALGSMSKNFRIERIQFDLKEPKIDMKKLWTQEKIELESSKKVNFRILITESDINRYFAEDTKKRKIKNPSIRIRDNGIEISGIANWWIFKTPFKIRGRFLIMNKSEIHFTADKIQVSLLPLPKNLMNGVMKKLNPIYDLSELPFPVSIGNIKTTEKKIMIESIDEQ